MDRKQVYELIDGERDYQNKRWAPEFDDTKWSVGDWIIFMERYLQEAKNHVGYPEAMEAIRKATALGVAAMECNETKPRASGI